MINLDRTLTGAVIFFGVNMLTYLIFNHVAINNILFIVSSLLIFFGWVSFTEIRYKKIATTLVFVGGFLFIAFALFPGVDYLCYLTQQDIPRCAAK